MAPGPVDVARGVVLDGRYRIEDVIGQGGMATVYRACDELLDRDVAVKLFPPTPDSDEVLRHQAEIRVLSHMNHPGLVALHDAGSAYAGGPLQQTYIVMELVPGPTLADLLSTGPLSRTHTARIGRQLAEAVAAVHAAEVVHRDIKPANILLVERAVAVREDPAAALTTGPVVKLADFGIARFAHGARLTMTGTTLGTATYLSPEQAAGGEVGPPTDVYALGLVLLECLTGEKAFTGTVAEVAAARLVRSPEIPAGLGPEWSRLLAGMTERRPEDRATMPSAAAQLGVLAGNAPAGPLETAVLLRPPAPVSEAHDGRSGSRDERRGSPGPASGTARAAGDGVGRGRSFPSAGASGSRVRSAAAAPADRTQPIPTVGDPRPAATVPRPRPDRGRPRSTRLVVGGALAVATAAIALVWSTSGEEPAPPREYPAVDGPLGDAIDDLAEAVQP